MAAQIAALQKEVEALKAQLHSDAAKTLEILKQAGLGNPH